MEKFYKIRKLENLVGHLTVGLAPHTSGGSLSRIIGFTNAQVCYAHPFYHAAKRRNCLSADTNLLVSDSNSSYITPIKELYENIISNERIVDDFDTKLKQVNGLLTYSLNPETGFTENKKIKSIIKAKSPTHLFKIKLSTGREFIGSPYHKVIVLSNGILVRKKILELDKDDQFFISRNLDLPEKDVKEFDLIQEFAKTNSKDIVIRGIENLTRNCVGILGGLKSTSQKLNLNKKTFSNYIYRDSIPLDVLLELLKLAKKGIKDIPRTCFLGVKRDNTKVPRIINVDKKLMRLLGYYISEGHSRYKEKSCYQVGFACTEQEIRDDITSCIRDVFKIDYYESKSEIFICNRIINNFFTNILCVGSNAKNKNIPSSLLVLPKTKIKELLRAYFAGDGSVEKNRLHVTCSSVNKKLLTDIGLQLLRFGIFYRLKDETKKVGGVAKKYYDKKGENPVFHLYYISIRSSYARKFYEKIGFTLSRKQESLKSSLSKERTPRIETFGDFVIDKIKEINPIKTNSEYVYDIEVEDLHNFPINDFIISNNCDGDEDAQMLLMDALLNFSYSYIPDKRGGKMDLPLVLTIRLDPSEIDKEAHNVDTLFRYPLDFYEATMKHEHSKELEPIMDLVSSRLGTELQYEQFGFTHDTEDISAGPVQSSYKSLKTMIDKMNAQLNLAAKIRAVDEADVAYKVIERHFLPDMLGNMRAFSKQSVRCPSCNIVYRRPPLQGVCTKCHGKLTLTVHEKSVKKYLEISKEIAKKYNISPYARQRIALVEKSIDSLFISDKVKTTKLDDFL